MDENTIFKLDNDVKNDLKMYINRKKIESEEYISPDDFIRRKYNRYPDNCKTGLN